MASDLKRRVAKAVELLIREKELLIPCANALYTPMKVDGAWVWNKFSVPDGLLLKILDVGKGEAAIQAEQEFLVIAAVLVQCEEKTSLELQNPWGKASIFNLPGGVWVDTLIDRFAEEEIAARTRIPITFGQVLFIAPKPSSTLWKAQNEYKRRRAILSRVESASIDASVLEVKQGIGAADLATVMWNTVERHLN